MTLRRMSENQKNTDQHPRGSSWCHPVRRGEHEGDPTWCWCLHEIVMGIGQCPECQEDADAE
jgi:hypothetical protein